MNGFLFWLKGYVHASIPRENAERFINILSNHDIRAYRFCIKKERCHFRIEKEKYKLLRPLARKTGSYPKIHRKCGGYYIYRRLLKHTGLYLGIASFCVLMYIISLFLWDIEFSGNAVHTNEQLVHFLKEQGIGFGSRNDKIDCAGLEAEIRKQFRDIGWVSVEIHGSRMTVRVKEASFTESDEVVEKQNSHMIAEQNGIVTAIIARSGTPMVAVGDAVKKGDVLISGWIDTFNEYNEPIGRKAVCADGDICLRAELVYSDRIPMSFMMKDITGKKRIGYSLSVFDKKIFSYIPSIPYERYDIITTSVPWKVSKNLYLPISHDTISCVEYKENEARYSNAQLSEICYRRYLQQMESYLEAGYRLISDNLELQIIEDDCFLQGTLTLEGPFWGRAGVLQEELEGVTAE